MSTDKELLELAAKAAGINGKVSSFAGMDIRYGFDFAIFDPDTESYWNPLTDDGDALRLAVKLKIPMHFPDWKNMTRTWGGDKDITTYDEPHDSDPYAATRRAVVRAAAAIGKEMAS